MYILAMNFNIKCIPACSDALASSSASLILYLLKLQNQQGYKIIKSFYFYDFITLIVKIKLFYNLTDFVTLANRE